MDQDEEVKVERVRFFIDELARMDHKQERINEAVTRRLQALENSRKGTSDELFDNRTIGVLFLIMVVPVVLPFVFDLVQQWRSSSSSS